MACDCKCVLLVSGDPIFFGHVLGGDAHMPVTKRIVQHGGHHVGGRNIAHLLAPPRGGQQISAPAHTFGAAGEDNFGVTHG